MVNEQLLRAIQAKMDILHLSDAFFSQATKSFDLDVRIVLCT